MNEENTRKLFTDFDRLFRSRVENKIGYQICGGFDCGDGWFNLIYELCIQITRHAKKVGLDPKAFKAWKKFGCLEFSVEGGDKTIENFCEKALERSKAICDGCGGPGTTKKSKSGMLWYRTAKSNNHLNWCDQMGEDESWGWWYRTACPACRKKSAKKQAILENLPQPACNMETIS